MSGTPAEEYSQIFTSQAVRGLKGAPLSCLILLILAGMPVSNEWLCMMSGYTDKPVSVALKLLASPEYQMISRTSRGWVLSKGFQMALPLINRNFSDSATTALINIDSVNESKVVVVGRNFSDSLEKHENPNFEENLKMCKRVGIGEPSASKISDLFSPLGEAVGPDFIKAHVDSLARGEGMGLAIIRILNDEFPGVWQEQIDALPSRAEMSVEEESVI